jgi:nitroimidazol reductase NimA-like FMN-containing flavoprotein (pyridoxamine 5'-phosphate oxidase superfamily)
MKFKEDLRKLFSDQYLGVLATQNRGQPYSSLVAFAAAADLDLLLFATTRSTRKYANLSADPRVAMLIDNRSNRVSDIRRSMAATATGECREASPGERDALLGIYLAKHPHMKEFVESPSCALIRVEVETYYVVKQFQKVFELHMKI